MRKAVLIAIGGVVIVLGVCLWFFEISPVQSLRKNGAKHFNNWDKQYGFQAFDPNGLGIFNELIQSYSSNKTSIPTNWSETKNDRSNANYLFVGAHFGLPDELLDSLLNAVANGSDLLISSDYLSSNFYERFFYESAYIWNYADTVTVQMKGVQNRFAAIYENDTLHADWYTFDTTGIIDSTYRSLGKINGAPFAFVTPYGKGNILFHSVPRLFTNVQLKQKSGFEHAKAILEELTPNRPSVWLSFARRGTYNRNPTGSNTQSNEQRDSGDTSFLSYIFQFSALRLAFVLALFGLLLFVIFRTKRRELVLSGHHGNRFTTSDYLQTITRMYQSKYTDSSLFEQMKANVIASMKRYFHVDLTDLENRTANLERLVERIGMDKQLLNTYFHELLLTSSGTITKELVQRTYNQTREIYLKTGILRKKNHFLVGKTSQPLFRSNILSASAIVGSMTVLIAGLTQLTYGLNQGAWLFALGSGLLGICFWWISKPVLTIFEDKVVVHSFFRMDNIFNINQKLNVVSKDTGTVFLGEDGTELRLNRNAFNAIGKRLVEEYILFIKSRTNGTGKFGK